MILVYTLTRDWTHNLGILECCSNQLSYPARARMNDFWHDVLSPCWTANSLRARTMSPWLLFPAPEMNSACHVLALNIFQRNGPAGSPLLVLHLPALLFSVLLAVVPYRRRDPFCLFPPSTATQTCILGSHCVSLWMQSSERGTSLCLGNSDLEIKVVSALCQAPSPVCLWIPHTLHFTEPLSPFYSVTA